jgi:hypothetical protein
MRLPLAATSLATAFTVTTTPQLAFSGMLHLTHISPSVAAVATAVAIATAALAAAFAATSTVTLAPAALGVRVPPARGTTSPRAG